jgi:hypothetical protein
MKENVFPWTDCVTQFTFDKVSNYLETGEDIELELIHKKKGKQTVKGQIITLRELSENAFYFMV